MTAEMDDLPAKSLDVLKSLARAGYLKKQHLGDGADSMCQALIRRGFATQRIAVFTEEDKILPSGSDKDGPNMTTAMVIEITAAGQVRASKP
jgi:hypothetical protein